MAGDRRGLERVGTPWPRSALPVDRANASSGSRRPCRSPSRCGPATRVPSRAGTTVSERPLNSPAALSTPHPRILVGGIGEKKTLRLVAQYADACNVFDMGPDKAQASTRCIRRHCEAVGRDYDDIEKTVLSRVDFATESDESIVDRVGRLRDVGTEHVIFGVARVWEPDSLDRFAALVAKLG